MKGWQKSAYDVVINWALNVDTESVRAEVERRRSNHPELSNRDLAERIVRDYSLYGLGEGALTSMMSGPFLALPAAFIDAGFLMRAAARMGAAVGLVAESGYFENEGWHLELITIIGDKPLAQQALRRTTIRMVNKYGAKLVTRRALTRAVPAVGGLIGGAWNWLELKQIGQHFMKFHFEVDADIEVKGSSSEEHESYVHASAEA